MTSTWRWLLTGADLLLLVLVAYCAARVTNLMVESFLSSPPARPPGAAPTARTDAAPKPLAAYATIYQRDLFNPGSSSAEERSGEDLELTDLNLKLWGTALIHGGLGGAFAIIEDLTRHKQALYRVGDIIAEEATLKRVEKKRVILSRNGKDEVLELTASLGPNASSAGFGAAAAGARIRKAGENKYLIDRREVEETMQNLSKVFTQARAVPYFKNGKTVGFRVFAIHRGSIFERIGLKNGDVIESINGIELTDPTRALGLFQELQGERHISVQLLRNSQSQNMSYEIR